VFWASDACKDYIMTKPIHESQTSIKGEAENNLREKRPQLESGVFFSIDCIPNYELIRELCSFGGNLLVLSPMDIQKRILHIISDTSRGYSNICSVSIK
jgi:predicted DNA-binding transcriptional regulator YafY